MAAQTPIATSVPREQITNLPLNQHPSLPADQLVHLLSATHSIARHDDLPGLYEGIAEATRLLAHADCAALYVQRAGAVQCMAVSEAEQLELMGTIAQPAVEHWMAIRQRQASPHSIVIADTALDPSWTNALPNRAGAAGVRTWLGVPLVHQGRLLGLLGVTYHQLTVISTEQQDLLECFAEQAALTLRNALLLAENAAIARLATLRMAISARMWDTNQKDGMLRELAESVGLALGVSGCAIYLQRGGTLLSSSAAYDETEAERNPQEDLVLQPILTLALLHRRSVSLADAAGDAIPEEVIHASRETLLAHRIRALLIAPLIHKGDVLGVLALVQRDRARHWDAGEVALIEQLAGDCARALLHTERLLDLKRQVAQLEATREQFSAVVDSLTVGVVVADQPPHSLMLWNPAAARLAAHSDANRARGLEDQPRFEAYQHDGTPYPDQLWPLVRAYHEGISVPAEEVLLRRPDGQLVPTLVAAAPLHNARGQVRGAVAVLQDLSLQINSIEHARLLKQACDSAVREERERLAREFHDGVAQTNTSLVMLLDALAAGTPEDSPSRNRIEQARSLARSAMAETRRVVWNLRPVTVDLELPGAVAEEELGKLERRMGVRPEVMSAGEERRVAAEVGAVLQRLMHVALENVWAHSDAKQVRVLLDYGLHLLTVAIEDDGQGFDPETVDLGAGGRVGLAGVAERARRVGGALRIESASGQGTRVHAELPYTPTTPAPRLPAPSDEPPPAETTVDSPTQRIRALLIDDHAMVRQGLIYMLQDQPDIEVVGEAPTGSEGLRLIADLQPDVVLCDLQLPDMSGTEVIARVHAHFPTIRCLVVTTYDNDDFIYESIKAGAKGYVLKDVSAAELADAVRAAARNESLLQPVVARKLVDRLGEMARQGGLVEALTEREVGVLQAVAGGLRNKEIAFELGLSESTIKTHLASIFGKLNVTTRTEAVARGRELGLIAL